MNYGRWAPYTPVAKRRSFAPKEIDKISMKGMKISPFEVHGLKISTTFWCQAWCSHLENFSDFENSLP